MSKPQALDKALKSILEVLPAEQFIRIHKSGIVTIERVVCYKSRLNGDYDVILEEGKEVRLSRNYAAAFKMLFIIHRLRYRSISLAHIILHHAALQRILLKMYSMQIKYLKRLIVISLALLGSCSGRQQLPVKPVPPVGKNKLVGGGCDGCELMYIGMPARINSVDTSPGWKEQGQKLLVTGTVYKTGGKICSPNVIIYYWHTDNNGYYSPVKGMDYRARRHGHIRGWVKTDENGKYSIYTIRPAPYPGEDIPAHIHTSIKEPGLKNEYYIDEFVFDEDKLLTAAKRKALENRGGSGILKILISKDLQVAEHNIILGLNIPGYQVTGTTKKSLLH